MIDREFRLAREHGFPLSVPLRQTISVGIVTLGDAQTHANLAEFVHAADIALYDAKHSGKNRWRRSSAADAESVARSPMRHRSGV